MKYGKTILFLMIAVFLFSIATVNATEVNDTSIASDHILSIESTQENTFEDDGINEILADNQRHLHNWIKTWMNQETHLK